MITQATIEPPDWSPWVEISAMREPSGVVYQDRIRVGAVGGLELGYRRGDPLRPRHRRAVLSSSRQAATLIPSMVPPVLKAAWHTGPRAASQALSWVTMAACWAADAAAYSACCTASIWASVFSVLIS